MHNINTPYISVSLQVSQFVPGWMKLSGSFLSQVYQDANYDDYYIDKKEKGGQDNFKVKWDWLSRSHMGAWRKYSQIHHRLLEQ